MAYAKKRRVKVSLFGCAFALIYLVFLETGQLACQALDIQLVYELACPYHTYSTVQLHMGGQTKLEMKKVKSNLCCKICSQKNKGTK